MNQIINKITFLLFPFLFLVSCTKQKFGPLSDVRPSIPVTVQNAIDYRPEPTVSTSLSGGGNITITLTIPANSGRTIKEVTKVAASTSYTKIQSTSTTGFYTTAPIPGNGTSVTFTTSVTEYFSKNPVSSSNPAAKANNELAFRFYFMITLDDGSVIIPEPVRVLVLS